MKSRALDLLAARADKLCAIATAGHHGEPAAALAYYAPLDDGRLLLTTHTTTRKWQRMRANPRVSLVAGWSFAEPHVQVDADVRLVPPADPAFEELAVRYYAVHPEAAPHRDAHTAVVVVIPTWARVTEYRLDGPPRVEEGPIGG